MIISALDESYLLHELELREAHAGARVLAQPQLPFGVGAAHKHAPAIWTTTLITPPTSTQA